MALKKILGLTETKAQVSMSGGSVVYHTLCYQSRDRKIDPRFSGLSDETLNRDPVSV